MSQTRIGVVFLKLLFHANLLLTVSTVETAINNVKLHERYIEVDSMPLMISSDKETRYPYKPIHLSSLEMVNPVYLYSLEMVNPHHYDILLLINSNVYYGRSSIHLEIRIRTKVLYLHAAKLRINKESVLLSTYNGSTYKPSECVYYKTSQIVIFKFVGELLPGSYKLVISFGGMLSADHFIVSKYTDEEGHLRQSYVSRLEVGGPRRVFPCLDHPMFVSTFNITIEDLKEYTALSNMEPESTSVMTSTIRKNFYSTPPIPAYLVAIAHVDLTHLPNEDTNAQMWCRSQTIKQLTVARNAFKIERFIYWYFQTIENIVSHVVILPKLPSSNLGGWNFLVLSEENIVYDESLHFYTRKVMVTHLIASNILSQWFKNSTGVQLWRPKALFNEAFTIYFSYWSTHEFDPEWQMMDLFVVQILQNTLYVDSEFIVEFTKHDDPSHYDNDFILGSVKHEDWFYYNFLIKKTSCLIRMLHDMTTTTVFRESVVQYVSNLQVYYESFNIRKFIKIIQEKYEQQKTPKDTTFIKYNIEDIMEGYLSQTSYPIVEVQRNYSTGEASIGYYSSSSWNLPITYTTQSELNFDDTVPKTILTSDQKLLYKINEIGPIEWLIVNIQQTGYYRVNYDNKNWLLIAHYLSSVDFEKIHVLNRAQIIDDAFYFLKKNKIDYSTFLRLIKYLSQEINYIPWHTMINILSYMTRFFEYPESRLLKLHVLDMLHGLLQKIGYDDNSFDIIPRKALRLLAMRWACKLGHSVCRQMANAELKVLLTEHLEDSKKILLWREDWTYCAGLMDANNNTWQQLATMFINQSNPENFEYLSCAENDLIIVEYLNSSTNNHLWSLVRGPQRNKLFISILKKHARKEKVLDAIFANFYNMKPNGLSTMDTYIHIIMSLYSKRSLMKLYQYVERHEELFIQNRIDSIIKFRLSRIERETNPFQRLI